MNDVDYHSLALAFASSNIPEWKDVAIETSTMTLYTGNSNKVFRLETSLAISPRHMIFRYFGPNEVTDKSRERRIFTKLSQVGLGPRNLGDCSLYRLEEFFDGFLPMPNHLFFDSTIVPKIAKTLKKMHDLDIHDVLGSEDLMTDANPLKWKNVIHEKLSLYDTGDNLRTVLEITSQESFDLYNSILPRDSPVVFSHLDPSPLNVLIKSSSQEICLVDYEFSGYAYRSIDFALMLNEAQMDFFYEQPPFYKVCPEFYPSDFLIKCYLDAYGEGKEMFVEVKRSLVATHFIWALWSLAMYKGPTSGYDYLAYGIVRFNMFKSEYQKFINTGGVQHFQKIADEIFGDVETKVN